MKESLLTVLWDKQKSIRYNLLLSVNWECDELISNQTKNVAHFAFLSLMI